MLKRAGGFIVSSLTLLLLVWMYCAVPEGPDAPSKTSVQVVTEDSEGNVFDYPIEESTGKDIRIGAAMYLPVNINSVEIKVTEKSNTVYSETFSDFEKGYYDTAWLECSFATAGVKTITITPESNLNLSAVISSIIIVGGSVIPESPKWLFDTISYSMNTNSQIALDLSKLITGTLTDNTIFELQSGSPDNDEVVVSTYKYAASENDIGTHNVNITVSNAEDDNVDLLVINLTVEDAEDDNTPPQITLISPPDTNVTFDGDTYLIALLCSDASGVASVTAAIGEHVIAAEFSDGYYQISLSGLSDSNVSEIVITAIDASDNSNTSNKTIHILTADQTHSVTYLALGDDIEGEVPVDNKLYGVGDKVEVAGNTGNLEKGENTFIGWNTAEDGSGEAYAGGEFFTMGTDNIVLYAQWTDQTTYTVSYDGNGNTDGAVPMDVNRYIEGASVTVKGNTGNLERDNETFIGWNTQENGSGTSYGVDVSLIIGDKDVTLYAQWSTGTTFTVTYDGNGNTGGDVPQDDTHYEEGMTVTVKDNTGSLVKTGYTFTGWNTLEDGSGDSYTADASITIGTSNLTFYAQWSTKPTFTITYDGNGNTGGDVPTDGTNYEEGMTATIKDNTGNLLKTGYTFTGWNTLEDGSGSSYTAGATHTMGTEDLTLYAQWSTKPTFTITYSGNGNSGGNVPTDGTNYEEGMIVTVKDNTGNLVKAGFTFSGWNTAANGSGTDYEPAATLAMGTENVTLYARWTEIPSYVLTLTGPDNGALDISMTPTFTWTVDGVVEGDVVSYRVIYGTSQTALLQRTEVLSANVVTLSASDQLSPTTTYFWQVVASSQILSDSMKSVVASFTTLDPTAEDHTGPSISQTNGPEDGDIITEGTGSVSFAVTDPNNVVSVTVSQNGGADEDLTGTGGVYSFGYSFTDYGNNTITITAIDGSANSNSNEEIITLVYSIPPSIESHPENQAACAGENVTFSVTAAGADLSYQWQSGSGSLSDIDGANGATLNYTATASDNGLHFACIVSNAFGQTATSNEAVLALNSVSTQPTASAAPTTVCAGQSSVLSVSGGSLGTGATWKWYTNESCTQAATGNSGSNGAQFTVTPSSTTPYYVRAEGDCNTTLPANVSVTVNSLSSMPTGISSASVVCSGSSITLSVEGGSLGTGASWKWYINSACSLPASGTPNSDGSQLSVSPSSNTTYSVRAEGTCGNTSPVHKSITVNTPSTRPTGISSESYTCQGEQVVLTVVGGSLGTGASWKWYRDESCTQAAHGTPNSNGSTFTVEPDATSPYYVRAEGTCGSTLPRNTTISVYTPPELGSSPGNHRGCPGSGVTLSQTVQSGTGPYSYAWYDGSGNPIGSVMNPYVVFQQHPWSISITCRVTDANGCSTTSDPGTLTSLSPVTITTQPADVTTKAWLTATLSLTATGTGLTYLWEYQLPDHSWTEFINNNAATITNSNPLPGYFGSETVDIPFRCTITSSNGCSTESRTGTLRVENN